jgi:hypothetical protein
LAGWAFLTTVCALTSLHCRPAYADEPGMVSAPLEVLPSGHLALKIGINGKGPFRMILDTGSPVTLLGGNAAQRAGLLSAADLKQPVLMGMRGQFTVKTIKIGTLTAKAINVLVLDHPTIAMLSEMEGPLDGILGFSFFSHYRTVIDYAGKQVSFAPITYEPQDIMATMMQRLMGGEDRRVVAPSGLWGMAVDKPDTAPGVRITRIYPQSAADAAGLKVGDRLLTLDDRWTDSVIDCFEAASLAQAGREVTVKALRDGKEMELMVRPHTGM